VLRPRGYPLVLTACPSPPKTPEKGRCAPKLAIQRSPLAVLQVVVAALSSALPMSGRSTGQEVRATDRSIAWFLSAFVSERARMRAIPGCAG